MTRSVGQFTHALDHNPNMHTAWHNRGHTQMLRGNLREAVADLQQAVSLNAAPETAQLLVRKRLSGNASLSLY
jgi:Flp pilus assembly protein TadD